MKCPGCASDRLRIEVQSIEVQSIEVQSIEIEAFVDV
jgi:hypothetical protein